MSDICKIFKLANGDTIIGTVVAETISYIEIAGPFQIYNALPNMETQSMSLEVAKWDFSSDYSKPFRVYKTSVVAIAEPTQHMEESYLNVISERDLTDEVEHTMTKKDEDLAEFMKKIQKVLDKRKDEDVH